MSLVQLIPRDSQSPRKIHVRGARAADSIILRHQPSEPAVRGRHRALVPPNAPIGIARYSTDVEIVMGLASGGSIDGRRASLHCVGMEGSYWGVASESITRW